MMFVLCAYVLPTRGRVPQHSAIYFERVESSLLLLVNTTSYLLSQLLHEQFVVDAIFHRK